MCMLMISADAVAHEVATAARRPRIGGNRSLGGHPRSSMVGAVAVPTTDIAPTAGRRRPGMTVRDELRGLTRQRLLAAAKSVFERDGYSRSTIGNITKEANVNRATFYLHFTDKADILLALRQIDLADAPRYWQDVDAALVDGGRDALRSALSNTLNWYEQHRGLLPSVQEAMATEPHLAHETEGTFARFADGMTGYLARVRPEQRDRAHLRLQLLMIQLHQMAIRVAVRHLRTIDPQRLLDELTDIWMLVLPPAPRSS